MAEKPFDGGRNPRGLRQCVTDLQRKQNRDDAVDGDGDQHVDGHLAGEHREDAGRLTQAAGSPAVAVGDVRSAEEIVILFNFILFA